MLDLRPMAVEDVTALFAIFSDPEGWWFDPDGRHSEPDETLALITRAAAGWEADGLSYWTVRLLGDESVIGMGGVRRKDDTWNLAYRFASEHQGKGYGTEVARAGVEAARATDPGIPVIAWIDEPNLPSIRVAEKVGLQLSGLHTDPSDGVERLAYVDREWG